MVERLNGIQEVVGSTPISSTILCVIGVYRRKAGLRVLMAKGDEVIDLHTHSTYSDGSLTPAALAKEAARVKLTAIALTDHGS